MIPNNNIMSMLGSFMANPMQTLKQAGLNLPQNMNSPQEIIQHLLNSGQISQAQVNQAQQMRNNPMFKGLFK